MNENGFFIDGDFPSGIGECEHHCSPTCHPAQIGPKWVYGCQHPAWPANRAHDFVPIVQCAGNLAKCELVGKKFLSSYRAGLTRRIRAAEKKIVKWKQLKRDAELVCQHREAESTPERSEL